MEQTLEPRGETAASTARPTAVDADPARRPGVPEEAPPHPAPGAHWQTPVRQQAGSEVHLHRVGLPRLTPVFGTAQPPRGLSGVMRRFAYTFPDHRARHWMLLLAADRVDVLEDRIGAALDAPLRAVGLDAVGERVRENPLPVVAAAVLAGIVVGRRLR